MPRRTLVPILSLAAATALAAQVVATAPPAQPPAPTLKQIGMIIYPAKAQTPDQQRADEAACTTWAETQTGLTLHAGSVNADSAAKASGEQVAQATEGAAVAGAARGAVAGVAIGAIAGDAGTGAAIGAVAGAIGGRRARRHATEQAEAAGAQQAQAQNQQALDTFKRAAGACLSGRGYTVS